MSFDSGFPHISKTSLEGYVPMPRCICTPILGLLALVTGAFAQTSNGRIVGTVSDTSLAVISGAGTTLSNGTTRRVRSTTLNTFASIVFARNRAYSDAPP